MWKSNREHASLSRGPRGPRGPAGPPGRRGAIGKAAPYEDLQALNEQIEQIRHELDIQLRRMAQIQQQLDHLAAALPGVVEQYSPG